MRYVLFVCGLVSLSFASAAKANCSQDTDYSVNGEFRRSDLVVIARATHVSWLDERRRPTISKKPLALKTSPGGFDPYVGAYYDFAVVRTFKGNTPARLRIFSENTAARTPFVLEKSLLLFVTRVKQSDEYVKKGDLVVDYCGNSALASRAVKRVRLVQQLANARP